jgi:secreted PhoX family phosphatase
MCAGSVFGGAHLGGEEYPSDCRPNPSAGSDFARFYGFYSGAAATSLPNPPNKGDLATPANAQSVAARWSCYNFGAIVQATPFKSQSGGNLDARVTKLRTMGRFSHETAVVAPDRRTVMLSADAATGLLALFVADRPGDLSSGTLYAAAFKNQQPPNDPATGLGASWDVEWIALGRGSQGALNALASSPATKFDQIFDAVRPDSATLQCPPEYRYANTYGYRETMVGGSGVERYVECLKVKEGQETAAAFLETQRYASIMGASTEFEKLEGVDVSKELKKWFIAITNVDRGMLDGSTNNFRYDNPERDSIRLPPNKCGVVIELYDFPTTGAKAWQPTKARVILAGSDKQGTDANNGCDVDGIASPDNLLVVPGTSTLLIAEDTGFHANNILWGLDVSDSALSAASPPRPTRILSAPRGAEITGLSSATFGAHTYIPVAFQHPNVGRSSIGYLGPFPKRFLTPSSSGGKAHKLTFQGIASQTGGANQDIVYFGGTQRVCAG